MNSPITGLVIAILILLPHAFYFAYPKKENPKRRSAQNKGKQQPSHRLFAALERIGLAASMLFLLVSPNSFRNAEFSIFLGLWMVALLFYLFIWTRYFFKGRDTAFLQKPFLFFSAPTAVFSSLALLFIGFWIRSVPLCVSAVVYASGHIFLTHRRTH